MDSTDLLAWATEALEHEAHVRPSGFCGIKVRPGGEAGLVWLVCDRKGHWIFDGGPAAHQVHFYRSHKAAQACWDYVSK